MAYEIAEAKRLVIEAGKRLLETGLIARTWGNVSARISDTQFVITPSGRSYENLTPDEIPELLDPDTPQQLLVSAFRRYRR